MELRPWLLVLALSLAVVVQSEITEKGWWKHAVFYQVYPRSFKDSDNDGNGDIRGIIEKLPVIKETGIDAIWISPIFTSPQKDQGYDISDYRSINPMFGTMDDFMELLDVGHNLGLKIILDYVPNHTSDQHEWFEASVNGTEQYKDYYVWVDGEPGKPPNNWVSIFFNSTWTWNEQRQQYYLHQFEVVQPDLNYRNPKVQEEMKDVMRFWLDMGVDGFRIDAVPFLGEDEELRDEPKSGNTDDPNNPGYLDHFYTQNQQLTYDIIYDWRTLLDSYDGPERIMMTEVYAGMKETLLYFGTVDGKTLGAQFSFNFNLITGLNNVSSAVDVASRCNEWIDNLPEMYTSNWVLGNHDQHRVATRLGKENVDGLNMLVMLLPGIGVTYNGEEIGMENGKVKFSEGQDPSAPNEDTFDQLSRDFERTPYQWDDSVNAGFNEGAKPWLPVSDKYKDTNLEKQTSTKDLSHYKIYKELLQIRKGKACSSKNVAVTTLSDDVLLVERSEGDEQLFLVFKLGHSEQETVNINAKCDKANILLTSVGSQYSVGSSIKLKNLVLNSHESLVIQC